MAGYLGTKAVLLSTTAATVTGDMTVGGAATISGAFTSLGIDDNAAATAMTLDASGNVGIGIAAPTSPLHVNGGTDPSINITGTGGTAIIKSSDRDLKYDARFGTHVWVSNGTTERMRIDSGGNVVIGPNGVGGTGGWTFYPTGSGSSPLTVINKTNGASTTALSFQVSGAIAGTITYTTTATAYNTSSDYRLKEDWVPMVGASERVQALKPINFAWKVDGSRVDGFLAHELAEVVPEAATGAKDAMRDEEYEITPAVEATYDDEGVELTPAVPAVMGTHSVPDYQGIDQSKLVPLLTAALQEAITEITALKARVTALEAV